MTALPLQTKVQKRSQAPEQEQAYKNSFNLYTNSIKSGKHTTQNAVCSRVCPCESAAGRLQEISVRSGPGSSTSLGVDLSPLAIAEFAILVYLLDPEAKTVTTTGYYAVRGPLGAQGRGNHRRSVSSALLGIGGWQGMTRDKQGALS